MSDPASKRQKSSKDVPYELIYWGGSPGRAEHIRLALEEGGAEYTDTAHKEAGVKEVLALIDQKNLGDDRNPPIFAPPALRHGDLLISQTPNIMMYLSKQLGLGPDENEDPDGIYHVNELALTALDGFSNEVHEGHHPIATSLYYEDQIDEAVARSKDYVKNRLSKYLGYFERVLQSKASGDGPWLYGGKFTYADLVLHYGLDGTGYQYPKAIKKYRESGNYARVFALYDAVQERPKIKAYLASDRRQKHVSVGLYRYYEALDVEP